MNTYILHEGFLDCIYMTLQIKTVILQKCAVSGHSSQFSCGVGKKKKRKIYNFVQIFIESDK